MQIEQIKQQLEEGKSLKDIVQIIPYLPFTQKKILCDNVINASLEYTENDLLQCDYFTRKIILDMSIIVNYTDVEINQDDILTDYDTLNELGVVEFVLENMNRSEKQFIEEMISKSIGQRIKIENSLEGILVKGINKLVDKIPDEKSINKIIKNIPKVVNKINPENLNVLKDFISKQQLQPKVQ